MKVWKRLKPNQSQCNQNSNVSIWCSDNVKHLHLNWLVSESNSWTFKQNAQLHPHTDITSTYYGPSSATALLTISMSVDNSQTWSSFDFNAQWITDVPSSIDKFEECPFIYYSCTHCTCKVFLMMDVWLQHVKLTGTNGRRAHDPILTCCVRVVVCAPVHIAIEWFKG